MTEEIDDQYLYHSDFTWASEWETFVARLEEIIHEWKIPQVKRRLDLSRSEFNSAEWETRAEKLSFANYEFIVKRYSIKPRENEDILSSEDDDSEENMSQVLRDVMCTEYDFPPVITTDRTSTPHSLCVLYGVLDFLVLAPYSGSISNVSQVKLLLSSVYIAVNNSNCSVPIFVQVHDPKQEYFLGVCGAGGLQTEFEMIHLAQIPLNYKYLTGLLEMFKNKIVTPVDQVTISAQFMYVLKDLTRYKWSQEFLMDDSSSVRDFGILPFGAQFDPINELHLFATWTNLIETAVVDSETYSDFDPVQAPKWYVHLEMVNNPVCLLSERYTEFLKLADSKCLINDLLGDYTNRSGSDVPNFGSSLNVLTESKVPTISKILGKTKNHTVRQKTGHIPDLELMTILYYLFPDADKLQRNSYPDDLKHNDYGEIGEQLKSLKSAPVDSLLWRLSHVLSYLIQLDVSVEHAIAHLWFEVAQEFRYRWERGITIPGVGYGGPDVNSCLLNQKLQMLNCCIEAKVAREKLATTAALENENSDSESEDELFFDCDDDEQSEGCDDDEPSAKVNKHKHSLWNKPTGRLYKHENLRLITTGEPLYIPVTQSHTPKTEDQVEEDEKVMEELGTDARAAKLRARLMSASLLSDMESFKAANPAAILEDFIRWYSPRDWNEEENVDDFGQKKGSLSARMKVPGNTWVEVWEAAKPVPARRQKRLFDETLEAEKVLHFFDTRQISGIIELLTPVFSHAVILKLLQEGKEDLPGLQILLQTIIKRSRKLTRAPRWDKMQYEVLSDEMAHAEAILAQAASIKFKFSHLSEKDLKPFMTDLLKLPQVEIPGGPRGIIGNRIKVMFAEAQKNAHMLFDKLEEGDEPWAGSTLHNFPQAERRHFVIRALAPSPSPCSTVYPQKMCAVIKRYSVRLAGCWTHDTTFY